MFEIALMMIRLAKLLGLIKTSFQAVDTLKPAFFILLNTVAKLDARILTCLQGGIF